MSAGGNGSSVSLSTGRRRRVSGWTRAAPSSGLPCFSQCRCWWRGQPQFRPQWMRGHRSRMTSRRSKCTSCHRRVYHWGLLRCSRCRRWCRWCCSDLTSKKQKTAESRRSQKTSTNPNGDMMKKQPWPAFPSHSDQTMHTTGATSSCLPWSLSPSP